MSAERRRFWTAEDDARMRADYRDLAVEVLAHQLGRTVTAVRQRALSLQLTFSRPHPPRLRPHPPAPTDHLRHARILLAYHMNLLSPTETAAALCVPVTRLPIECAREAYRGQLAATSAPEEV